MVECDSKFQTRCSPACSSPHFLNDFNSFLIDMGQNSKFQITNDPEILYVVYIISICVVAPLRRCAIAHKFQNFIIEYLLIKQIQSEYHRYSVFNNLKNESKDNRQNNNQHSPSRL